MSTEEKEPQEETEQSAAINAAPAVWDEKNKEIALLIDRVARLEDAVCDLIHRNCLLKPPVVMADEPQDKGGIVA